MKSPSAPLRLHLRRRTLAVAVSVAVLATTAVAVAGWRAAHPVLPVAVAGPPTEGILAGVLDATTTTMPTTTTDVTTTTAPPPPTTHASTTTSRPRRAVVGPRTAAASPKASLLPLLGGRASGGGPWAGLGAWVDVFDFDPAHTNNNPSVGPADVDRMAATGVRTLYLQAARSEDPASPGDLVEPTLLAQFLARAHQRGMAVVAWYLPHLANLGEEMRHLRAILAFAPGGHRFDGVGLDVEWRASVPDAGTRSAQLVELSRALRAAAAGRTTGAIVMPPVVTDVINPGFWPGFPWKAISPYFDAWLPMSYWTSRAGTPYRDAYGYTAENIRRLRADLGNPGAAVHAIGGIGDTSTAADYQGFARACAELGCVGRSVYDWHASGGRAEAALRG